MKAYLLSLVIGVLVGLVYALFQVRSPAPPVVALVGLLGILIGERVPSFVGETWPGQWTAITSSGRQSPADAAGSRQPAHLPAITPPSAGASQTERETK